MYSNLEASDDDVIKAVTAAEFKYEKFEDGLHSMVGERGLALSGGEKQRVAIARALITKPALVLADEPTGNLDKDNGVVIYELIEQLKREHNTAFIVVTHDLELASKLDKTMFLRQGKLTQK